jgi:hypothetical protein
MQRPIRPARRKVRFMDFYFSGIAGPSEYPRLEVAGVRHLLDDPFDLKHIPAMCPHVVLGSGAYRAFNFNKALERIKSLIVSGDTSKWLDGARYSYLIFTNTRTGRLSQSTVKALKLGLDREERCVRSACNLEDFILTDGGIDHA